LTHLHSCPARDREFAVERRDQYELNRGTADS